MSTNAEVVVIDDDDIVRCAMSDALEAAGFRTTELPSPIGATHALMRGGVRLVVIDVQMPAMRGDTLSRLFRRNDRLRDLKVILVSAVDVEHLDSVGELALADAVVRKQAGYDNLVAAVRRLLGRR